jgi:Flp pilus assembly protein TadG
MSVASEFGRILKRFRRDAKGTVAIMAGLAFIPMLAMAGAGLDVIRASNVKTQLQNALDAGALAAAASPSLSTGERIKLAEAVFAENWPDPITKGITAVPKFKVDGEAVTGSAEVAVPTTIMRVLGFSNMDVTGEVAVNISQLKKAEIVLVLDYSWSMTETSGGKVKYVAMKDAAKKLVADLSKLGKNRVQFGLVPYSHHVWVTLPKAFVRGQSGSGSWTGCTQDRPYPANLTDATPTTSNATKWGWPQHPTPPGDGYHGGCGGYEPNKLIVRPLTDNYDSIADQLEDMRPYAYTHIALGTEFGWHLLSPNAPFDAANYGDKGTDKILVVLTDGRQTEGAFGPGGSQTVQNGRDNLEKLCENIKETGITVMTVAFDLRDDDTKDRLQGCASDPDKNYFDADSGAELAVAFEQIKNQITQMSYLSK